MPKFIVDSSTRLMEVTTMIVEAKSIKEAIEKAKESYIVDEFLVYEDFSCFWENAMIKSCIDNKPDESIKEIFKELIYKEFSNKNTYRGLDVDKFYAEAINTVENNIHILETSVEFRKTLFKYAYKNITAIRLNKLKSI